MARGSATSGRVAVDSTFIGRATRRATVSGYIWPRRLGTSSPKMMVSTVIIITTKAVAPTEAPRSGTLKVSISQCATGSLKAASPTMPFNTPMDVMPICTVDNHCVGFSCSAIAATAPGCPLSTITCKRALRLVLKAISDMAKAPLITIRKSSSVKSMRAAKPLAVAV